jgi:hypothetical protein
MFPVPVPIRTGTMPNIQYHIYLITLYCADDMMKMSVIDLGSLAAAYPDLTQEERQLLADIRR